MEILKKGNFEKWKLGKKETGKLDNRKNDICEKWKLEKI